MIFAFVQSRMEKEIDFEEQLKLEALEKERKEREAVGTYTDKDGVVFEFDAEKKAWFPKVHVQHLVSVVWGFPQIHVQHGNFCVVWRFPKAHVHLQHWYFCVVLGVS